MRRFLCFVLSALVGFTCNASGDAGTAVNGATPGREFDPNVVRVPPDSALGKARKALSENAPGSAFSVASSAIADASEAEADRLRWVAAQAAVAQKRPPDAARLLEAVARGGRRLSRWAALRVAELLEHSDPKKAATVADDLQDDWAGRRRARVVHARSLAAMHDERRAISELRSLVAELGADSAGADVSLPLARILENRPKDREEALALYRRVSTRAPLGSFAKEAELGAARVLKLLPKPRRRVLAQLAVEDAEARARALFAAMQHEEAEKAFEELAKRLAEDPEKRCDARLMQGQAMLRRKDRARGAALLERVAAECKGGSVRAAARYHAGKAHGAVDDHESAIRQYEALEKEAPNHRLADDALFRAALQAGELGDEDGMTRRLEALPGKYPNGDMRGDARFALAWSARANGNFAEALTQLDRAIADDPSENEEDIHGRALYWRARTLWDLKRHDDAKLAFQSLTKEWPLSYYAQQALARLEEIDPRRAAAVTKSMRDAPKPTALTFTYLPEMKTPEFETALELLRVGELDAANAEIARVKGAKTEGSAEFSWVIAAVLDRAGALPEASRLVRRRLDGFRQNVPVGRDRALWRLAYPNAFAPIIERAAAAENVPAAYVRAVAREETSFDPRAESVAHAYGLIQLILPTARRFGKEIGLTPTAETLRQPEVNVRIGTRYIAFLWKRYASNTTVVPAAYNAGQAALDRWLKERPSQPLDEWVENIPYNETRRYTRRVLQTYGIYTWFETGKFLKLPKTVPPAGAKEDGSPAILPDAGSRAE